MLLIVAGVYSQFSGPPSATMPVVVSGPADVSGEPSAMEQAEIGLPSVADSEAPARESSTATGSESGDEIIPAKPPTSLAAAAPLPVFPQLPEPKSSAANGFSYYEIELGGASTSAADSEATSEAAPGTRMRLILYLPPGEHADGSLSCVLVAPAGTSLLEGADCFDDSYRDETLPYVEAGFAVVGYSLDGALEFDQPTDAELNTAYRQFRAAQAGLINARNALEFVLARVPQVAPDQIYSAGHSSAGTLSLLFAAHEPRLAGSIAYAPCTDPENRLASLLDNPAINRMMPGVSEFVRFESPLRKAGRITCPVFLFHAEDDSNVPVAESRAFAERLAEAGNEPALKLVAAGGHDDAMINSGIPAAIEWLKQQMLAKRAGST
jgi:acetyl esterase/lipase